MAHIISFNLVVMFLFNDAVGFQKKKLGERITHTAQKTRSASFKWEKNETTQGNARERTSTCAAIVVSSSRQRLEGALGACKHVRPLYRTSQMKSPQKCVKEMFLASLRRSGAPASTHQCRLFEVAPHFAPKKEEKPTVTRNTGVTEKGVNSLFNTL
uniref:Putative secreted protein n=1 Tax=Amblyomma tuberculatum TaxID=48802 RepID=A0A6M2E5E8_9ACAR